MIDHQTQRSFFARDRRAHCQGWVVAPADCCTFRTTRAMTIAPETMLVAKLSPCVCRKHTSTQAHKHTSTQDSQRRGSRERLEETLARAERAERVAVLARV